MNRKARLWRYGLRWLGVAGWILLVGAVGGGGAEVQSAATPEVLVHSAGDWVVFATRGEAWPLRVEIFTLSGERIFAGDAVNGQKALAWPLTDFQGRPIAQGVYLYALTIRDERGLLQRQVGKIVVGVGAGRPEGRSSNLGMVSSPLMGKLEWDEAIRGLALPPGVQWIELLGQDEDNYRIQRRPSGGRPFETLLTLKNNSTLVVDRLQTKRVRTKILSGRGDDPLEIQVDGKRAFKIEPTNGSPNVIGGFRSNNVGGNVVGATIAGGGRVTAPNRVTANYGTVGGGSGNRATGQYATVPGGQDNRAQGAYSFAAGRRAKAEHRGAFVWADSTNADFSSQRENQFRVRAYGGARFDVGNNRWVDIRVTDKNLIKASNGARLSLAGVWISASDRALKENFREVNARAVLEKLARLPVQYWNYKVEGEEVVHLGPTAQDFYAAFGLGDDETGIAQVDADGVAFASIQALYALLREKDEQIERLTQELEALRAAHRELASTLQEVLARLAELERQQPTETEGQP